MGRGALANCTPPTEDGTAKRDDASDASSEPAEEHAIERRAAVATNCSDASATGPAPVTGTCRFEEAYQLLGLARSTAAERRRALEVELDRETGRWRHIPEDKRNDKRWRREVHLLVPEWGGNKPPGEDFTFDRTMCVRYRDQPYAQTLAAFVRASAEEAL